MLKRFIMAALIASLAIPGLLSGEAWARINTRQNDDGTADHVGDTSLQTHQTSCLGGVDLTTTFGLSGLTTGTVVNPVSNAQLRTIYTGRTGNVTGASTLKFYIGQAVSPLSFLSRSSATPVSTAFITMNNGGVTRSEVISTLAQVTPTMPGAYMWGSGASPALVDINRLPAGATLMVEQTGGTKAALANYADAMGVATFVLCPR